MQLNYKSFGQGDPVIILHGLFGTLDNWQTIARQLAEHYSVFILDQRNHGRSPHADVHDYPSMAEDLRAFMESQWMYNAHIIGHSMGGKTAMQFALEHPDMVKKLVVVDIAPKGYPERHNHIFDALFSLDLKNLESRQQAEAFLTERIPEASERLFLMKNLSRVSPQPPEGGNSFEFKMNLPVIYKHYGDILAPIESDSTFDKPTLFIRGAQSKHILLPEDEPLIKSLFPDAAFATVENAGHWVHADQPAILTDLLLNFFR
jgi:pimeloyl-ACP methyl ester carboxylesterase